MHVVGHSMGGLVARYYVQRLAGDERVHTLATLGTPHRGTERLTCSSGGRCAGCGSARPSSVSSRSRRRTADTRFVAFWSDLDELVVPKSSARIDHPDLHARNVFVRGAGHLSLPIDGRVVHEIATAFAHLDVDGSTLAAGDDPIASDSAEPAREAVATRPGRAAQRR